MTTAQATYAGRTAALATKHGKGPLIATPLAAVGLEVVVTPLDTDSFGTFTGEVPRRGTPREVAVRKARAAIEASGLDVGLASEGSFGPHPAMPGVTTDLELVVLVDDRLGVTVSERVVTTATAAASLEATAATSSAELERFCNQVGFPDQALICRPADGTRQAITKAITSLDGLHRAVRAATGASRDRRAVVETDLRAHLCPTRRVVIVEAATRLARRLASRCPRCETPGFGQVGVETGLPCRWCGLPTDAPAALVDGCARCDFRQRRPVAGDADPSTCPACNP